MYKSQRIAVVVPAHNEARHIAEVINSLPDFVDHIIVVDDCSSDDTASVIKNVITNKVVSLSTPHNQGVGGATMFGYTKAIELESDIAVKMDGDGQMSP